MERLFERVEALGATTADMASRPITGTMKRKAHERVE